MKLQERKDLLLRLGSYIRENGTEWQEAVDKAYRENNWFIPPFTNKAAMNIAEQYLSPAALEGLIEKYAIPEENGAPRTVGIVMAGNVPLVGFHDLLSVFITGHIALMKPSSKDDVLVRHLVQQMTGWNAAAAPFLRFAEMLKGCDAYIATGSNNTARYFEYYFRNVPSIIRKNRTSVAILRGGESSEALEALADDVHLYFGLGCRNVTKLYVPKGYDFIPLLEAFKKYSYLIDHNKYKNNYDYNLALLLLNHTYYMTNGSILLVENESPFSPISQLHYEYYEDLEAVTGTLREAETIQCTVGHGLPFGAAQVPGICDFADGVDTIAFLMRLKP